MLICSQLVTRIPFAPPGGLMGVTCLHFVHVGLFVGITLPVAICSVSTISDGSRLPGSSGSIVVPAAAGVLEQIRNQIQIYGEHHVRQ